MKRLMKNFAILIALFLLLGTVGIDVQVAASSLQNELSATDTITGDETEETKPEALEPKASESEPTEPEPTESTEPTEPTEPEATEPTEPEVTEPSEPEVTEPTETKPTEPKEPAPSETEPEDLKEEKPDDPIAVEYAEDPAPWMYGSARRSIGLFSNGTPSSRVVDPNLVAENDLGPGQVRMTKTAAPVAGLVNTWDITLRVAGRPEQVTSDIVLVIDVSGSMGYSIPSMPEDRLYYAKQAARNFVDTVLGADPLNTRISIVSFSGYNNDGSGNTAIERHVLSNNATTLKNAINNLSVAGSNTQYTHTQSGIARARQVLNPSTATKKTIVLFSDGLPNRNYRINSPTVADFYTGSSSSDRLSRKDLAASRFDYSYSVQDGSYVNIGGTRYYYSSPNSAIAEGAIARSAGYTIYAIGMYAGTQGQATLNEIASPGKAHASDAAGLNTVFQEIAGQLGSPVSTATITDPMASGFIIDDTGTIVKTSGNANYNAGTKTLTWDFPLLSQSGTGDIKYEQLTYRIVITEDTPYVTGNTLLPTNGTTAMNFTDVAGQESINNFLIPEVDPVFVTLDKVLLDGSGSPISSTKDFTITLDGVNYLINADDPIKVVKKVWNVGNYQVSETAEPDYITSYEVNGVATQQLTLAQAGADQNVVVTNQEKALGQLTVKKVFNNIPIPNSIPSGFGILSAQPLKFSFTVTGPNGYEETFELAAGEEEVLEGLHYGTYTVLENTTGYLTTYNPAGGEVTLSSNAKDATVTVTNRVMSAIDVDANKVWAGEGPTTHPDVWFRLYRAIEGQTATAVAGAEDKHLPNGTLQVTWGGMPQYDLDGYEYIYSVKELINVADQGDPIQLILGAPAGYSKTETGLTVTNTWRTVDPANLTSIRVTKSWLGVVAGTNPKAIIELYDIDDPNTVIMTAELTPDDSTVIWEGLPFAKGNPLEEIDYRIREITPAGYNSTAPVKHPVTISSIERTTPNNSNQWPISNPSFVVTKPTGNQPWIVWTLNHLPVAERAQFLINFVAAGTNLGPFAQIDIGDPIVWIEGAVVDYDIFPADPNRGQIDINVQFDGDGNIISSTLNFQNQPSWTQFVVGTYSAQEFTLTNSYEPEDVDVDIGGTKVLAGRDLVDGEFGFNLYESDINGDQGSLLEDVTNVGSDFNFPTMTFTDGEEGTYYYLITEVQGTLGGVDYDLTEYLVRVIISDDGQGQLTADVTYLVFDTLAEEWVQVESIVFNNDYTASGSWTPQVSKELTGRDLTTGEFSFELRNAANVLLQTKTNALNGSVVFDPIFYTEADIGQTYIYTIKELVPNPAETGMNYDLMTVTITVEIQDNADGTLTVTTTYPADTEFNNEYTASGSWTPAATKILDGRDLTAGEFSFDLKRDGATLQTKQNAANGNILFDPVNYTQDDINQTYTYTIVELLPASLESGMTYDPTITTVQVEITDAGNGELNVTATYLGDAEFNNVYRADGSWTPVVRKVLTGRPLQAGEFTFELRDAADNLVDTTTNTAGGSVTFNTITFTQSDIGETYSYKVVEIVPATPLGGITYDTRQDFIISVTIGDAGDGELTVTPAYPQDDEFNNDYSAADVDVDLGGTKVLEGRDLADGEFEFNLYQSDIDGAQGTLIETVTNVGSDFDFATMIFTDGEEGTYYYLIKEVQGILGGVTYDLAEYFIRVIITDDLEGNLTADLELLDDELWIEYDADDIVFNNDYTAADIDVDLGGMKALEGRELLNGEFEFNLYESDSNGTRGTQVETVTNVGSSFDFTALTFTDGQEGMHYFLITEVQGVLGGVGYDLTEYLVEIVITDNGLGQLEADVTYMMFNTLEEEWEQVEIVAFNNDYTAADIDVDLGGMKTLAGRELADGEFEFNLYESDSTGAQGTLIETVTNVGSDFDFAALTFTDGQEGMHYFLITEVQGTLGGVGYDLTEYLVEVEITDNSRGQLEADVTYMMFNTLEQEWEQVEIAIFNNDYSATDVDVDLGGTKVLTGRELADGEFEFNLYESDYYGTRGTQIETVANVGNSFDFTALTFIDGEERTYYYLITEVQGTLGGVDYDLTEYLVRVEITDNGRGQLEATVTYLELVISQEMWVPVEIAVFNNDYTAADIDVDLGGIKALEGRDLVDGEFEFNLYESDSNGAQGTLIETVTNVGSDFNFTTLNFMDGEEGTYYFLVKEAAGTAEGIEYDSRMYLVIIRVTDNNQGQLESEVSYLILGETEELTDAQLIAFDNRYINPVLVVDKMVAESSFSEAGDELNYSFSVTNTGNLAFVKLTVNDPKLGIVDLEIDLSADPLLPGETYVHTFTVPYVVIEADVEAAAPIVNTLTVIGDTEEGFQAEDEDDVTVPFEQIETLMPPIISLEKLAKESSFANAGDLIHYYFIVTNDGMVPVVKLIVNDPKLGIDNLIIDLNEDPLMPGETYTYEFSQAYVVTQADVEAGKIDNTLTVKGENEEELAYEATDDLTITREKILPHIPKTGESRTYWTGIAALMLGGAVALILINRRRNLKIQETDQE